MPMRLLVVLSIVATLATPVHARSLAETVADARAGAPALGAVVVSCKGDAAVAVEGVARIDRDGHLGEDARFNIGSNAKSMLASLAGVLVQERRINWTTTIGDVLGKDIPDLDATVSHATLAQLLSHRSGLAGYDTGAELRKVVVEGDTPSAQRRSFVRQVVSRPPAQEPGKGFVYSNAGHVVAGAMLERVGGKPFDQLMQEKLFRPLGMTPRFGSQVPPGVGQPWGHRMREGGLAPYDDPDPVIPPFLQAAGDVSLTLADYGRYLREHLCGLRGQRTRVLDTATVRALHAPQGSDGAGMG